ncbi:MAG: putative membrane protein [uncultured bacterium]|nr:MAG: putative membrane protein [uncultured bacterium]HBH17610.1 hypothetical protein [Cyanobacteria bacterium UBA9579]
MNLITELYTLSWERVLEIVIETFLLFWFIIFALRFLSYRTFSQTSPEYLLLLILLGSGLLGGIASKYPNFWAHVIIGAVIIGSTVIVQKFQILRELIEGKPIILVKNGKINTKAMERVLLKTDDLNKMARGYGVPSHEAFEIIILETNGHLTGVLKPEYR